MAELWIVIAVVALVGLVAARAALSKKAGGREIAFADAREEQLTLRLARELGCAPDAALSAVRTELELAPQQADEVILKRAKYHYQREAPEKTCAVFRDRAPG
jgi:hypothetical protein